MKRLSENKFVTDKGIIRYWTNELTDSPVTLVFLPGLTADHRMFAKQIDYFRVSM